MQCNKALELEKTFEAMIALLEIEHRVIRSRDTEVLSSITLEKEQLAKSLELQGYAIIRELRLTADTPTSSKLVSMVEAFCGDSYPDLAQNLKNYSEKVQELNNRNGILLQSMMRINEQSLNILTGRSAKVTTYQSSGQLKPTQVVSSTPLASV
jgi:flagellar biosynthesis/type III secretory pathway chaperone